MTRVFFLVIASLCALMACRQPFEVAFYGTNVAEDLTRALAGVELKVQSDPKSQKGGRLSLGPALGGQTFEFSVPNSVVSLGVFGNVEFRLQPMRMSSAKASIYQDEYRLSGLFDERGMKITAQHLRWTNLALPDIGIKKGWLTLTLRPMIDPKGRPSYSFASVRFRSVLESSGATVSFRGYTFDPLQSLSGYQQNLERAVQTRVEAFLNSRLCREAFTSFLDSSLRSKAKELGFRILSLRRNKADFFATVERI